MARVFFISAVNSRSKKKEKKPIMSCASSGHITKLKQSIFALRYLWAEARKFDDQFDMLHCEF
jgi:hypothetical protein